MSLISQYPTTAAAPSVGSTHPAIFFFSSLQVSAMCFAICQDAGGSQSESEHPFSREDGMMVHSPCNFRSRRQSGCSPGGKKGGLLYNKRHAPGPQLEERASPGNGGHPHSLMEMTSFQTLCRALGLPSWENEAIPNWKGLGGKVGSLDCLRAYSAITLPYRGAALCKF